jgi:hypothetical protein
MNHYTNKQLEIKLKKYIAKHYPEFETPEINVVELNKQALYFVECEGVQLTEHWFDYMVRVDEYTSAGERLVNMIARECVLNSDTFKQRIIDNNIEVIRF